MKRNGLLVGYIVSLFLYYAAYAAQFEQQSSEPAAIWYNLEERTANQTIMIDYFRNITNQLGTTENPKIPVKGKDIVRIATYDVHAWQDPYNGGQFDSIIKTINFLNADILILQSVKSFADADQRLKAFGYMMHFCCEVGNGKSNCVFSRYPLIDNQKVSYQVNPNDTSRDQRCFVRVEIALPNNNKVSIYATDLEKNVIQGNGIYKEVEDVRLEQLKELVNYINTHDQKNSVVIGLGAHAIRKRDLERYTIGTVTLWELYREMMEKQGKTVTTKALEYVAKNNHQDCFDSKGLLAPQFTSVDGTRIDYLFFNQAWKFPITGCYGFYSWRSGRIPLIMDIDVSKTFSAN
jgi:exonuclease III